MIFFYLGLSTTNARKLNAQIELLNRWFFIALAATLVSVTTLPLIYTYIKYYVLNAGEASFYLYCPTWFVFIREKNKRYIRIFKKFKEIILLNFRFNET